MPKVKDYFYELPFYFLSDDNVTTVNVVTTK